MTVFGATIMQNRCLISATSLTVASVLAASWPAGAQTNPAQAYPSRQIELVIPFAAGGTTDTIARMLAQRFTESWGQTVIVNARPGGGSVIATAAVAKAPPDGHTLLVSTVAFSVIPAVQKLPYDPIKDFAPISELASLPLVLVVHPSLPITNLKEFVAYAKASPTGLDYASAGPGTSTHLAGALFQSMTGGNLVHVPFKGNSEVMNALLGGHVKIYFSLVPTVAQHIKAGTLRALAVTTEKRLSWLPDIPTIAESGFPGYEVNSWQAIFAPAATPKDILGKINGEVVRMINTPQVLERIRQEGAEPVGSSVEDFTKRLAGELTKWAKVAKEAGLTGN
jgi:tripartite-type tricarboxylate transporter receptor subunit TctC